jgi:hypothetical protein
MKKLCIAAISVAALSPVTASARPKGGAYVGLGLGYASASGDRGISLKASNQFSVNVPNADEFIRTDFGSGLSFELRFGVLIGPVAPEISIFGHGTTDAENGAGYPTFQLRFHPLMLVDSLADVPVDANVYAGVGYAIGGYHHLGDDDGKGWDGLAVTTGLAVNYEFSPKVMLGIDLKFALPQYSSWIFDYDDDITFEPAETPSTVVLSPTLQLQAFF